MGAPNAGKGSGLEASRQAVFELLASRRLLLSRLAAVALLGVLAASLTRAFEAPRSPLHRSPGGALSAAWEAAAQCGRRCGGPPHVFLGPPREPPRGSKLRAKGRPGGGGGVGPKKKTPQQQQQQKQQQLLGGFGKHKAAKKKAGSPAPSPPKRAPSTRPGVRKGAPKAEEEDVQALAEANLAARDLPYDIVSPEVFEVYKAFGRLGDPLSPGASLPPSRRLFVERLFKGFTRLEGLSLDQFRIRLEYDWRFLLPLPRDPLAPPGVPAGAPSGPPFEGLDLKLCRAWAAKRGLPLKTEEPPSRRQASKVMRRRTAFLWTYSRALPPHLAAAEAAKALKPPEPLPAAEVGLQEARRRVSAEVTQQGLHPATLDALWSFFTDGKSLLDRRQAEEKMDVLIGPPAEGAAPRLWLEASEVPGLLEGGPRGAVKSEALQIKHLFPRGGRLLYRNPDAVSLAGRKPNPRGLPLRLSIDRLWSLLGKEISERMQAFDWQAYEALEAEVLAERHAFLSSIRKTIALRQQRRRFCLASRRLLDSMWLSVLHARNSRAAEAAPLGREAELLKIHRRQQRLTAARGPQPPDTSRPSASPP
ncbi:hypothetical protein Efla_001683 [Eimeria flavescens]